MWFWLTIVQVDLLFLTIRKHFKLHVVEEELKPKMK